MYFHLTYVSFLHSLKPIHLKSLYMKLLASVFVWCWDFLGIFWGTYYKSGFQGFRGVFRDDDNAKNPLFRNFGRRVVCCIKFLFLRARIMGHYGNMIETCAVKLVRMRMFNSSAEWRRKKMRRDRLDETERKVWN